jgi:uncharacterized protein (TIGR02265 family)
MADPSAQRLVFPVQAEGLIRGLQPDVTDRLKVRLRAAGLDLDLGLPPAWPAEQLALWLDLAAEEIYGDFPKDEAHRRIGRRFIDGWQRTMLGAASAQVLKLVGPKRALERLTRAFRTGDNFSESVVTFPSPTVGLVTMRTQRLPHYIAGILDGGIAMLNVQGAVTIMEDTDAQMVFRVEWQA